MFVAGLEHADIKEVAGCVRLEFCALNPESFGFAYGGHMFRHVSDPDMASE